MLMFHTEIPLKYNFHLYSAHNILKHLHSPFSFYWNLIINLNYLEGAKFPNVIFLHSTIICQIGLVLPYLTAITYHQSVFDMNRLQPTVISGNRIIAMKCFSIIRIQSLARNSSIKPKRLLFWKRLVLRENTNYMTTLKTFPILSLVWPAKKMSGN